MQQRSTTNDSPGVTVLPPKIFSLCFLAGAILEFVFPTRLPWSSSVISVSSGGILSAFGFLILMYAHSTFQRNETHTHPNLPAKKLISFGIYTITRNPMYLGSVIFFVGLALVFSSLWLAGSAVMIWCYLQWYVIPKEEAYMLRKFGDEYALYKKTARRWV
ncbi:methyltransferase family protein [Halodesulfovibrio aestuarii]|uniref:methyltransferase family protein n=1 Tax=Halodesulfovibrio aestuarii TaxID=126333 RepID=UPI003D34C253